LKKVCGANEFLTELFKKWNGGSIKKNKIYQAKDFGTTHKVMVPKGLINMKTDYYC
jgi:hypothetical protein